jgi:hypothetical protein
MCGPCDRFGRPRRRCWRRARQPCEGRPVVWIKALHIIIAQLAMLVLFPNPMQDHGVMRPTIVNRAWECRVRMCLGRRKTQEFFSHPPAGHQCPAQQVIVQPLPQLQLPALQPLRRRRRSTASGGRASTSASGSYAGEWTCCAAREWNGEGCQHELNLLPFVDGLTFDSGAT